MKSANVDGDKNTNEEDVYDAQTELRVELLPLLPLPLLLLSLPLPSRVSIPLQG